jgi:predicted amidohydrolase YtcJ
MEIPEAEILETKIEMTVVGGKLVYQRQDKK